MLRTIIIDDERKGIMVLSKMLETHCPQIKIIAQCFDAIDASEKITLLKPDIIFLDIAMPGKSGIQMLNEMEEINFMVVFVTAHDHFMLQAIRLSALDYLLKPIHEDELIAAVIKAESKINILHNKDKIKSLQSNIESKINTDLKITLPSANGFIIKPIKELIYCEANNNYTRFIFQDGNHQLITRPLSYYDNLLTDCKFIRIHKSYLVNLDHIIGFVKSDGGQVLLSNQHQLDVAKRKKEIVMEALRGNFIG